MTAHPKNKRSRSAFVPFLFSCLARRHAALLTETTTHSQARYCGNLATNFCKARTTRASSSDNDHVRHHDSRPAAPIARGRVVRLAYLGVYPWRLRFAHLRIDGDTLDHLRAYGSGARAQ